jgi:hypothetical protein
MSDRQVIETPQALGERYWRDLEELLEQGEISLPIAQRVRDDLFEPAEPGEIPKLRWSVWCRYLQEVTGDYS